jgi:hypothetical protein
MEIILIFLRENTEQQLHEASILTEYLKNNYASVELQFFIGVGKSSLSILLNKKCDQLSK